MKRILIVTFFIFFCVNISNGQQSLQQNSSDKCSRFYGATAASKDVCFITVKTRPAESGKHHNWEHYYANQKLNYGYRFSQLFGFVKSSQWSFESGFVITKKIMDVDFENDVPEVGIKNASTNPVYYKTIYHCLDIPLRVLFTEGQKKLKFLCSFGLNKTFSLALNRESQTFSGNEIISLQKDMETKNIKRIFSSSDWGAGIRYDCSAFSQIRFMASVQRSYATTKSVNKKVLFWNSGLSLAYCYLLR